MNIEDYNIGDLVKLSLDDDLMGLDEILGVESTNGKVLSKIYGVGEYELKVKDSLKEEMLMVAPFGEHIEPIIITDDVLHCCKFKRYSDNNGYHYFENSELGCFVVSIKSNQNLYCDVQFKNIYLKNNVKYLHELQHIYKCILGKDLQVDKNKLSKLL